MQSKSPAQAKMMKAAAQGFKKPGGNPSVAVAKEFSRGDEQKSAHKTKEGRADHKREMNAWAEGKGKSNGR